MKYIKFILAVSLLLCIESTWACGVNPLYDATDTPIYRVNEDQISGRNEYIRQFRKNNIALWKKQTSDKFPDSLVEETVYHYSSYQLAKLYNVASHIDDTTNIEWANKYAQHLATTISYSGCTTSKYINTLRFLLIAKRCEEACKQLYNDPWYYPVKGDNVENTLEDIISNCRKATNFKTRYFLQEVRALIALNRYDECISRWEETKDQIDNDLFYKEIELRVARAYLLAKISDKDKAVEIYARYGDAESLMYVGGIGPDINEDKLSYVYKLCPDAEYLKGEIQQRLNDMNDADAFADTTLLQLAKMAIKDRRAKDIAMWYYVAAAVCDKAGQYDEALNYINHGERLCTTRQQKSMFKVARIFVESKSMEYNSSYDRQLFNDLQWLDKEIKTNLTHQERTKIKENSLYILRNNEAYGYYWADAMRRILIKNVIPKAEEAGYKTRALQLANYADYCLVRYLEIDKMENWSWDGKHYRNIYDYCNNMFKIAYYQLSAVELEKYVKEKERPRDDFGQFLVQKGFRDMDYWNELLGTMFLRDHNYSKAVEYLEKVSPEFQYYLNVYTEGDYMKRDPFEPDLWERGNFLHDDTDYKLRFAREMESLQKTFESQCDPNRRASAMIRFAIGMRNSVNYCWALTRYEDAPYYYDCPTELCYPQQFESLEQSKKLITTAFTMFTCDEIAARHRYMLRHYKYVMDNYSYTDIAQYIARHCDTWRDYLKNKK